MTNWFPSSRSTEQPLSPPLVAGLNRVTMQRFREWVFPFDEYENFDSVIDSMIEDPFEARVITELCVELTRDGSFRTPLRVASGQLWNGYHRFCALALCRVEEFDVWVVENGEFEPSATPVVETEITFRIRPLDSRYATSPDGFDNAALFCARSLSYAGQWLDADGASMCEDRLSYIYYVDEAIVRSAKDDIIARLAEAGVHAELISVQDVTDHD